MTSVVYTDDRRVAQSCLETNAWDNNVHVRIIHVGRKETVHLDVTFTSFPDGLIPSYYVFNVRLRVREPFGSRDAPPSQMIRIGSPDHRW